MNCGNRFGGDPGIGAWVTYGLGSENQDLPGFIVLPELSYPQGGAANWSNGFLPAFYQGTPLRPAGSPILDLQPPHGITRGRQRQNLDLLSRFNKRHAAQNPQHQELQGPAANTTSQRLKGTTRRKFPNCTAVPNWSQRGPGVARGWVTWGHSEFGGAGHGE